MGKRLFQILEQLNDFLEEHDHESEVAAITLSNGDEFDITYKHRKGKASLVPMPSSLFNQSVAGTLGEPSDPFSEVLSPGTYLLRVEPGCSTAQPVITPSAVQVDLDGTPTPSYVENRLALERAFEVLLHDYKPGNSVVAVQARNLIDSQSLRTAFLDILISTFKPEPTPLTLIALIAELKDVVLANDDYTPEGDQAIIAAARNLIEAVDDVPDVVNGEDTMNEALQPTEAPAEDDVTIQLDFAQSRAEGMEPAVDVIFTEEDKSQDEEDPLPMPRLSKRPFSNPLKD